MFQEKNGAATNKQPFNWSRKHKSYTALLEAQKDFEVCKLVQEEDVCKVQEGEVWGRAGCRALLAIRLKC